MQDAGQQCGARQRTTATSCAQELRHAQILAQIIKSRAHSSVQSSCFSSPVAIARSFVQWLLVHKYHITESLPCFLGCEAAIHFLAFVIILRMFFWRIAPHFNNKHKQEPEHMNNCQMSW